MLTIPNMQDGYITLVQKLLADGSTTAPRGQETLELLGFTFCLQNPTRSLPLGIGRGINPRIAAVEALQLIGGESHPDLMLRASKNFAQFRDGTVFHGAYGPRLRAQLPRVIDRLRADPDTRQAVVTIWDPALDMFTDGLRDYPCTVSLQYMVRDGALVAHTFMRSNDIWWGTAYDVFQFTQLQLTIASVLNIPAGPYYHHANSFHIYTRDVDSAKKLSTTETTHTGHDWPVGVPARTWAQASQKARDLLAGQTNTNMPWYSECVGAMLSDR